MDIAAVYDAKTKAESVAGHNKGTVLPAASAMLFAEQLSTPGTACSLPEDAMIGPESTKAEGAAPTQESAKNNLMQYQSEFSWTSTGTRARLDASNLAHAQSIEAGFVLALGNL